jgi:hypothetical protein
LLTHLDAIHPNIPHFSALIVNYQMILLIKMCVGY